MKISPAMNEALNEQIKEEFESAFLYLSMVAYFESQDLPGFAQWMKIQYTEELAHGMKFFDFLNERDGDPEVPALKKPKKTWDSPLAAFEAAYAHEQHISGCIAKLVLSAREQNDVATENFLQWFVTEQVEEEANSLGIVKQLKMVGDNPSGLFMIDRELGTRTAVTAE